MGKQQLYNLGITIRKRYSGYLPDDYDDNDIYIKSSDKSRTLMSAYTFLVGLYPPTPKQTWNSNIPWQPIPVHSLPRELDPVHKKNIQLHYSIYLNNLTYTIMFLDVSHEETMS